MFKKLSLVFASLAIFAIFAGCAHYGVAKLPSKDDMFITMLSEEELTKAEISKTGQLETSYQPMALLHTQRFICAPCGAGLEKAYRDLEMSLQKDLVDQAKRVGADGIIGFQWSVFPVAKASYGQVNPVPPMPCDQKNTWVVVELRGIAVKTCKKGPSCK